MKRTTSAFVASALALALTPVLASPASAQSAGTVLSARLEPLNGTNATAVVEGTLLGDELTLEFSSQELLSNARHAQGIYIGGQEVCPDPGALGSGTAGATTALDGQASYGELAVSLTTSGSTDLDSQLDFQRYPLGSTPYKRTIELDPATADAVMANRAVLVIMGADLNGNGRYDGDGRSDLVPELPEEVTAPTACGVLSVGPDPIAPRRGLASTATQIKAVPVGGVQTGGGSTSGVEHERWFAAAALLLVLGAALLRRRPS